MGSSSEIPSHGSETSIAFGSCRFFNWASGFLLPPPNPLTLGFGGVREGCVDCGGCGSLCRKSGTISALLSRPGQQILCRPLPKNRTAVFRQPPSEAQLPPSGRKTIRRRMIFACLQRRSKKLCFAPALRIIFSPETQQTTRKNFRVVCPKSSNLFSAGTVRSHRKKYDFSVKWVLGQIPNKPHRWENVPTDALLASL